ncbi:uncharacterized protein IWZ02DRAFT_136103 [Phyllosticta citriasiana]|uniref:Secreted protein n=1 Tax=Phyllosticta citriasiana TaxID=595635 RepID=A0ABR1KU42_9PEZI
MSLNLGLALCCVGQSIFNAQTTGYACTRSLFFTSVFPFSTSHSFLFQLARLLRLLPVAQRLATQMPHSDLGTTFNWEDEDAGHGTERSSMAHSGGVSFTCWFRNFAALYTAGLGWLPGSKRIEAIRCTARALPLKSRSGAQLRENSAFIYLLSIYLLVQSQINSICLPCIARTSLITHPHQHIMSSKPA